MDDKGERMLKFLAGYLGSWREPIPPRFHRTLAGEPFQRCDYCHRELLVPGTGYLINKLYVEGELRQETVRCRDCREDRLSWYSEESLRTQRRLWQGIPNCERCEIAADPELDRGLILTGRCILCDRPREDCSVYSECVYCEGSEIVYFAHPMIICGECMARLFDALSEETKDHRRRYFEDHYGLPPDLLTRLRIDVPVHLAPG